MEMVMNRSLVLRSITGHTIQFVKGEPTYVPKEVVALAMERGAVPVDGQSPVEDEPVAAPEPVGDDRMQAIRQAIEAMVVTNKRQDFTASGRPDAKRLSSALGFDVSAKDRDAVWEAMRGETGETDE